jgi:hypothetical protein
LLLARAGVQQGVVFELSSVVDMVPELPAEFKGKVSWVKVGRQSMRVCWPPAVQTTPSAVLCCVAGN